MKYLIHILIVILAVGQVTTLVLAQEALAPPNKMKVDPSGTWRREYDWYDTRIEEVVRLNLKEDGKVVGTLSRNDAASEIKDAKLKGNELSFSVSNDYQGTTWTTIYTGIIKEDEINGTVVLQVDDQSWDWAWIVKRSVQMDDVVGTWQIHIDSPDGRVLKPTMKISKKGDKYKGAYKSTQGQELDIKDLRLENNTLKFTVTAGFDGGSIKVAYQGRPYGDKISGSLDYDFEGFTGQAEFTAQRKQIHRFRNDLPLAFPGAEGYGRFAKGGRGGDVYHVTNLNDSGPGSLREGIESAKGPRTIVFEISGTIELKSQLRIRNKGLTIAGQTAPGDGITLKDHKAGFNKASDIIVRYIRVRLGDKNKPRPSGPDAVSVDNCDNLIFDHVSISWGIDGNQDTGNCKNYTFQWCILSEGLHDSTHHKGPHGMCGSFRKPESNITIHHCIFASSRDRHPTLGGNQDEPNWIIDFRNNVIYNWSAGGTANVGDAQINLINNIFRPGPETGTTLPIAMKAHTAYAAHGYMSGNVFDECSELTANNYAAIDIDTLGRRGSAFGSGIRWRITRSRRRGQALD
jgi:pectate lyase